MKVIATTLTAFCLLSLGLSAQAQVQYIATNGSLENWGTLDGNNQGTPSNWTIAASATAPTRIAGLVSGSNYAAMIQYGVGNTLAPTLSGGNPKQFELDFVFAATDPGSTSNRSFNLNLTQASGAAPMLNLRTIQGSSGAGYLTLQAFSASSGWSNLVTNLQATSLTSLTAGASDPGMHAYNIALSIDLTASSYTLSYGLVGDSMTSAGTFTYFQSNNGNGLASVAFIDNSAATNTAYAVDNVAVFSTVPEPNSAALLLLGLMTLVKSNRRKLT